MLSLSFSPAHLDPGKQTKVELLVANTGPGRVYSVRLVPRFPSWVRVCEGPSRIEIPRLDAGATSAHPFVLIGDESSQAVGWVPFPVVSFEDSQGTAARLSDEVALEVGATQGTTGRLQLNLAAADELVVGQWGRLRVEVDAIGEPEVSRLKVAVEGEVEQAAPAQVDVEPASATHIEVAVRPTAAGRSVPVTLKATGVTGSGKYVQIERQEFLNVSAPSDQGKHVYNIGKVEGNVGPDGTFIQNNTGGVVGRSSADAVSNIDPELLADLQHLLSTEVMSLEEHREDREAIEAFVSGRAQPEEARPVVRRLLDSTKAIADNLAAEVIVRLAAFAAETL